MKLSLPETKISCLLELVSGVSEQERAGTIGWAGSPVRHCDKGWQNACLVPGGAELSLVRRSWQIYLGGRAFVPFSTAQEILSLGAQGW